MTTPAKEETEIVMSPIGAWTITKHKDGHGETGRCECGCICVVRGQSVRRSFCDKHFRFDSVTYDD